MTEHRPRLLGPEARAAAIEPVVSRFGVDATVFDHFHLTQSGRKYVMILASDHVSPEQSASPAGIPLMRMNLKYPKLTTAGALLLGRHATRNVIRLSAEEARRYVNGADLTPRPDQMADVSDPGYVLVSWDDTPLGLGLLLEEDGVRRLKSLYPRRWAPAPIGAAGPTTRAGIGR